jgi:hypothetical protein
MHRLSVIVVLAVALSCLLIAQVSAQTTTPVATATAVATKVATVAAPAPVATVAPAATKAAVVVAAATKVAGATAVAPATLPTTGGEFAGMAQMLLAVVGAAGLGAGLLMARSRR